MIKLIGAKRAVLLGIVLALNLLIVAAYLLGIDPMRESEETALKQANAHISKLAQDTQSIKAQLASFPANYARYQDLEKRGFFSAQDRFEAGRSLDALREQAGILGYNYRLDAIRPLPDPRAEGAGSSLITSQVILEHVSSVLDTNIYALMRSITANFPSHARIEKFEIKRVKDLDEGVLQSMEKNPVQLIDASILFDWFTVVPTDKLGAAPGQPGGFRGR